MKVKGAFTDNDYIKGAFTDIDPMKIKINLLISEVYMQSYVTI